MLLSLDFVWWNNYEPDFSGLKFANTPVRDDVYCATQKGQLVPRAYNSGMAAVLFCDDVGAEKVFLLGFDAQLTNGKAHFHGDHKPRMGNADGAKDGTWLEKSKEFAKMIKIPVINCTRQTALRCWERRQLEDVL
jgi:hypothetical protein